MSREQKVIWEKIGNVALVKLNRPEVLNAVDLDVWERVPEVAAEIDADDEVRCVVITGSGDKAFSAGLDLKSAGNVLGEGMFGGSAAGRIKQANKHIGRLQNNFSAFELIRAPVIAAVNGYCLGAGTELILTCDIRVAGRNAVFSIPEVILGVVPDMGSTQRLPRVVGMGKAKQMLLTGARINAEEAYRIGLIDELFEPEKTLEGAMAIAKAIAANAPLAVQATKQAVNMSAQTPLAIGLKLETLLASSNIVAEDVGKGMLARIQKKEPKFEGK